MNKKKNKLGLIEGAGRRFVILFVIYIMVMITSWTTIAAFFEEGLGTDSWIFWVIIGVSFLLFVGFVSYVEYQQLQRYGEK
jgi:hypothetical protein